MGFSCGIVGLPNVGKSTLFNALTATQAAEAANYPFCTIEPNVGRVAVPDERLEVCARLGKSAKIIPTQLEFVDIAGLVRGASQGQGLGNQFLGHIREVDAIAHVLRCFGDDNVVHVEGSVDPVRDAEMVETELMLADLDSLERRVVAAEKRARGGDKEAKDLLADRRAAARRPARRQAGARRWDRARAAASAAIAERQAGALHRQCRRGRCRRPATPRAAASPNTPRRRAPVPSSSRRRSRPSWRSSATTPNGATISAALGLDEPGLVRVIRAGYRLLDLVTFLTVGPKEARAWTVPHGTKAPQAAGVIHTRFREGLHPRRDDLLRRFRRLRRRAGRQGCRQDAARRRRLRRRRTATSCISASMCEPAPQASAKMIIVPLASPGATARRPSGSSSKTTPSF